MGRPSPNRAGRPARPCVIDDALQELPAAIMLALAEPPMQSVETTMRPSAPITSADSALFPLSDDDPRLPRSFASIAKAISATRTAASVK